MFAPMFCLDLWPKMNILRLRPKRFKGKGLLRKRAPTHPHLGGIAYDGASSKGSIGAGIRLDRVSSTKGRRGEN